jgi:hypothetical protein
MKFGKQSYRAILEAMIEKKFEFVDYFTANPAGDEAQVILRHDVDFYWPMAREMAEIDASYKIKSSFTILPSCPLYNPLTNTNVKIINEIHQLGHNIVLHHGVLLGQTPDEIRHNINKEMQALRTYFPFIQPVFIWHEVTVNKPPHNMEIPGMINAYHDRFVKDMYYTSDSYLNRPEVFLAALEKYKFLQLLFHPFIWMSEKDDMVSMIAHTLGKIILECDNKGFMLNKSWQEKFPGGIPPKLLKRLEDALSS